MFYSGVGGLIPATSLRTFSQLGFSFDARDLDTSTRYLTTPQCLFPSVGGALSVLASAKLFFGVSAMLCSSACRQVVRGYYLVDPPYLLVLVRAGAGVFPRYLSIRESGLCFTRLTTRGIAYIPYPKQEQKLKDSNKVNGSTLIRIIQIANRPWQFFVCSFAGVDGFVC